MPEAPASTKATNGSKAWLGLNARRIRFLVLVALVGVTASLIRLGFDWATGTLTQHAYLGRSNRIIDAVAESPWWLRITVPAVGIILSVLIVRMFKATERGGVSDVMEVVALGGRPMPLKNSLARTLSALVTISLGGSAGREGPLVHFASAVSGQLGVRAGVSDERRRILIGCGMAAGLTSTYGTPLSAVLFVMEIVAGGFATELLVPCLLSAVASTAVLLWLDAQTMGLYATKSYTLGHPGEIGAQALMGLGIGLLSVLFAVAHSGIPRLMKRFQLSGLRAALFGGLLVGGLVACMPQLAGNGYYGIVGILHGEVPWHLLLVLALAKLLSTHLTIASGGAGGLFTPTLFVGAGAGAFCGHLVHQVFPAATPQEAYALIGMSAMLAGTMRSPLLAVVMVVEMTRDVYLVPSLMVAVAFALLLAL